MMRSGGTHRPRPHAAWGRETSRSASRSGSATRTITTCHMPRLPANQPGRDHGQRGRKSIRVVHVGDSGPRGTFPRARSIWRHCSSRRAVARSDRSARAGRDPGVVLLSRRLVAARRAPVLHASRVHVGTMRDAWWRPARPERARAATASVERAVPAGAGAKALEPGLHLGERAHPVA
jgi:hypothetical protein